MQRAVPCASSYGTGLLCEIEQVKCSFVVCGWSVDPLDSHQRYATPVEAGRLTLDVVEIVQNLELIVTQVRRIPDCSSANGLR